MNTQRGVSLIELMIAMVIGLFLILGMSAMFAAMRQTSNSRNGLSTLQDNERMAMTFLGNAVQGAGAFPIGASPGFNTAASEFPAGGGFASAGQIITGTGAGAGADTLTVRFISNPVSGTTAAIQGCSASITAPNALYTNSFSVSNGALYCSDRRRQYPTGFRRDRYDRPVWLR